MITTRDQIKGTMLIAMSEYHSGNSDEARRIIDAQLSALEAAGVRLVPSEPSRHMLVAAHMVERDDIELTPDEHRAMYAAFVAASPYAPPDSP